MSKHITDFTIVEKQIFEDDYFILKLQHPNTMPPIEPRQFVEVAVPDNPQVMLRRPISIHDVDYKENTLSMLIHAVGSGTRTLQHLDVGRTLNLVYPLGNGYRQLGNKVLLVGGGAGIAPLYYLSKCLKAKGVDSTVILGGQSIRQLPAWEKYQTYARVGITTNDGSIGEKGIVTQHSLFQDTYDHIYCCGPTPMMKAVARHSLKKGIECELSLENMMACGIGACLCCVCKTDEGNKCVCKEGPVFNAKKLTNWIEK